MSEDVMEQIGVHLEFLGYQVSKDGEIMRARHQSQPNFLVRRLAGGILFVSIFGCNDNAKKDRLGYLEMLNSLNDKASVARFYADKDSDLFIEAWYPDYYDRAEFGVFMQAWDRDILTLLMAGAERYIR